MDLTIKGLDALLAQLDNLGGNVENALVNGIDKSAQRVKRAAKLLAPVDTGRLRNSIQHKTVKANGKIEGSVFTNVEYAPYVEFGARQSPTPFMFPALVQNQEQIKEVIVSEIKKAIKEVSK